MPRANKLPEALRLWLDANDWPACCFTCRAWAQLKHIGTDEDGEGADRGRCTRYAPKPQAAANLWDGEWLEAEWPITAYSDGCMEHMPDA